MCQCTPTIRTPFCGRGDCKNPHQKEVVPAPDYVDLPKLPLAAHTRRQQQPNGSYCMVPAYTEAEMLAYAQKCVQIEREWCADEADCWIGFDKNAEVACSEIAAAIRSHK